MTKDEIMMCPRCGNNNIVKIGSFYQCQATRDNRDIISCGFIGEKIVFSSQKIL